MMRKQFTREDAEPAVVSRDDTRVSSRSMWPDAIWRLDNPSPGQKNDVGWEFPLPNGSLSTAPEHYMLLESAREVVLGMLTDGGEYGRTLKPGSMAALGTGLRELFRWMVHSGYQSYADLTLPVQKKYFDDLPYIIISRTDFYLSSEITDESEDEDVDMEELPSDERTDDIDDDVAIGPEDESIADAEAEQADSDELTWGKVSCRVLAFYAIFAQAKRLEERGFGRIEKAPFDGRELSDVVGELVAYTLRRIPPLPEEVALPLLKTAIEWTEHRAADVIAMQNLVLDLREKAAKQGLSKHRAGQLVNEALFDFQFSVLPGHVGSWRKPVTPGEVCVRDGEQRMMRPTDLVRYSVIRTTDASNVILQYLAGLRPGEVCGLEGGVSGDTGLPSCIEIKLSKSGLMELFYVKSILAKGVETPRPEEWLIGCRPAGDEWLPLTVKALCNLNALYAPWRALKGSKQLILSLTNRRGLPHSADAIAVFQTPKLLRTFRTFVANEVDLSRLPNESSRGESLVEYRESKGKNIVPRQGRKTFAAFILESRSSLLEAVRDHFKHLSSATTEGAYFPQSTRLREDIDDVIVSDTISFFVEATRGKKMVGNMAGAINDYFGSDEFKSAKDGAELDRRVRNVVLLHDMSIFFDEHGKCLIRINPLQSRCRKATGTASWKQKTPDFSVRSPSMCSGCAVFAADRSNLPFWENRQADYTAAYKAAKAAGNEHEYGVHLARARQAEQMVKALTKEDTEDV